MPYVNNKGTDQPAHPHSLINAFVVHCLDNIIPLVSITKTLSLYLASVAAQAGLNLPWSQTLQMGFLMTWLVLKDSFLQLSIFFSIFFFTKTSKKYRKDV